MTATLRRRLAIAFALYCAVTVALFPRLALHPASVLPHDLGDPLLTTWILWWNAHHLPFTSAWWDGLFFYPMHGALALSDHRVGLGLIASPVQWLGGSPVLAHNVTFLSTFPLCAIATHALALRLTRNDAAAFVAGLIFGFNPYRMSHLPHLELLAAWWLPLAILAAHEYVDSGRAAWLAAFVGAFALQGMSSGYYVMYAAPLIGGWIVWFARHRWQRAAGVAMGCVVAVAVLSPVLLAYRDIQNQLNLTRTVMEIENFSADITALATAWPQMMVWHTPDWLRGPEGELFPGTIAVALLVVGALQRSDPAAAPPRALTIVRAILAVVAVAFMLGGLHAAIAPGPIHAFGFGISSAKPDRPLGNAVIVLVLLGMTSASFRRAFAGRSPFAFYAIATCMLWLFALGPRPRFLGDQVLPVGPYALLMALPGYSDRLRVPARFAMIAIMTLAVAAAIAVARIELAAGRRMYRVIVAAVCAGILLDGWVAGVPMLAVPAPRPLAIDVSRIGAVIDLPIRGDEEEVEALYQSQFHGRPVVNGYSGYEPRHHQVLRLALRRGDDSVFDALAAHGPVLVRIDSRADAAISAQRGTPTLIERLAQRSGASRVDAPPGFAAFLVPAASLPPLPTGTPLPVRAITATSQKDFIKQLIDGNPNTMWGSPSTGDDEIDVEFDGPHRLSGLSLTIGDYVQQYPRALAVSTSLDGSGWTEVWRGACGGVMLRALLDDARQATMTIPLEGTARFVRIRQLARDSVYSWSVSELVVLGVP